MATISELARHAGVSVEGVLRVLNSERVSEDVEARVKEAIEAHGYPHRDAPRRRAPAEHAVAADTTHELPDEHEPAVQAAIETVRDQVVGALADATRELESTVPEGVGSLMYEALRVEVRPVLEQVAVTGDLTDEIIRLLRQRQTAEQVERRERLEDLALLIDLMTTSWQNVDRRLGRIERKLEELGTQPREELVPRILRTEDRRRRALESGSRVNPTDNR